MDILTGIASPFQLEGERRSLSFTGNDHAGEFRVELRGAEAQARIQGSWDRSDNEGYSQSGFYYDLAVTVSDLQVRLERDHGGQGRVVIATPEGLQVSAPVGDLSQAQSSAFEPDFFSVTAEDVTLETDGEEIALALYPKAHPPVRYVIRQGAVCREE